MLMYISQCRHGFTTPHKRPTMGVGLSKWYTGTVEMSGSTTSIARILTSLPLCRVCTLMEPTTGFIRGAGGTVILRATDTILWFLPKYAGQTLILDLCRTAPRKVLSPDPSM